jgi:outer membrane protein TolC
MRAQARQILDEARAEVAALARRRDQIAEELSQLSGVIEALAVPGPQRGQPVAAGQQSGGEPTARSVP